MFTVCKYCEKIITQFNECSTGTVTVSNNESVK
jgi:hypothetical protein